MKRPKLEDFTKNLPRSEWGYAYERYYKANEGYIDYLEKRADGLESQVEGLFWRDANSELPKSTKSSYSDDDVYIICRYTHEMGRTKDGVWVDMKNKPLEDVILWAHMPIIPNSMGHLFDDKNKFGNVNN